MSSSPLAFSDAELDVIMTLAQPLDPAMRDPFLRAMAIELARYQPEAIGPGLVNRVGRSLQRQFLVTPGTRRRAAIASVGLTVPGKSDGMAGSSSFLGGRGQSVPAISHGAERGRGSYVVTSSLHTERDMRVHSLFRPIPLTKHAFVGRDQTTFGVAFQAKHQLSALPLPPPLMRFTRW